MTKIIYTTRATATGGRDGRARTDDGAFEVALATPREMGGNGKGNNPEQLFAAGYAACFLSAMKLVGTQGTHARVPADASVSATVGIGPRADKGFGLAVTLDIVLPGLDPAEAQALVAEADTVCPYSHAVRGNIEVTIDVSTGD
ncbi:organic hydroperoxide resistance protein [Porphyrobacter sp. ULC335]|uniref:organic hydroperoxide resistance protein n=1 Tax=Porphyrobacter sp. ULC335 TaxID=2854260 RepID=UPI00221F7D2B|nr:organic hydroperoxide resistance protein [Porphyrobacter sp. ULC335]UYV16685.1 organic hydroperoxide resistance protein [Porphyrobacter sp. ULC335]